MEDLSRDVELNRMKDKQVDTVEHTEEVRRDVAPIAAVAEPSEYQYGVEIC